MTERTEWKLSEWNEHFKPAGSLLPEITAEEIAEAAIWLTTHNYPVPSDCPKNPNCPAFRPACLIFGICRAAKGMCESIPGMKLNCPTCIRTFDPSKEFKDERSKREFHISGLCQICQDRVFRPPVR